MIRKTLLMSLLAFFISGVCLAEHESDSPLVVLENVSKQLTEALEQNKAKIKKNKKITEKLVRELVLPYMDVYTLARSALGRNAWAKATAQERKDYVRYFRDMLVRYYGHNLSAYSSERVTFFPLRGGYKGRSYVQVHSTIARGAAPPIRVTYNVWKRGGVWKVYDFSIDGASMVQSYRTMFRRELAKGGMPRLIKTLKLRGGHF